MLKDFSIHLLGVSMAGIDISDYAIAHADPSVAHCLKQASATHLPFDDDTFDLVISINAIRNLDRQGCLQGFREIQRVSRGNAFVMVDGWKNTEERRLLEEWVLTARTMLSSDDWIELMLEAGYDGD